MKRYVLLAIILVGLLVIPTVNYNQMQATEIRRDHLLSKLEGIDVSNLMFMKKSPLDLEYYFAKADFGKGYFIMHEGWKSLSSSTKFGVRVTNLDGFDFKAELESPHSTEIKVMDVTGVYNPVILYYEDTDGYAMIETVSFVKDNYLYTFTYSSTYKSEPSPNKRYLKTIIEKNLDYL